jgi:hypothetical protein
VALVFIERVGFVMSEFSLSLPEVIILVFVCAAYAAFLWVQFRAGRLAVLWSCIGVIFIQAASAFSATNMPASIAAAGFHAALVGAVFTASRWGPKPSTLSSKDQI